MTEKSVAEHYTHGSLVAELEAGIARLGKTTETVTLDDLAPVDEFHIGGRQASEAFLDQLAIDNSHSVLDVGCGIGGASRFTADRYGTNVDGIDLTDEYIETGNTISSWVGLRDRITLRQASALEMPFSEGTFDRAYMMHVGMNIADKTALFAEIHRVMKPGGVFGVYDVMRFGDGDLAYPVPWAATPETSALAPPEAYRAALEAAGFTITAERNRREFALAFFEKMQARAAAAGGPPALGIHLLMGESRAVKVKNMLANIKDGIIAPVEMVATV